MATNDVQYLAKQFSLLQGRLVREFLARYKPKDLERFRDVPNGTIVEGGAQWMHKRHGAGILFININGVRVNAHVAMIEFPEGIDGGRLFEYIESLGMPSVVFAGREYSTTKPEIDILVQEMTQGGLLRRVSSSGRFPHHIFEII